MIGNTINLEMMTKEQFMEVRRSYIGGSDIGYLFEANKYNSEMTLWLLKTGQVKPADITNPKDKLNFSEPAYWGINDEPAIAKRFFEETGLEIVKNNFVYFHPDYPYLASIPDYVGVDKDGRYFLVQMKSVSEYKKKEWIDDIMPFHYELQVHHELLTTRFDYGFLVCRIGSSGFFISEPILPHEPIQQRIVEVGTEFWDKVVNMIAPKADASEACTNYLKILHPKAIQKEPVYVDNTETNERILRIEAMKKQVKSIEKDIEYEKNLLMQEMGDVEILLTADCEATWKNQNMTGFDKELLKTKYPDILAECTTTKEIRVLRTKEKKGAA